MRDPVSAVARWRSAASFGETAPKRPAGREGEPAAGGRLPTSSEWNRDEWDTALSDGTVYRLFVERDVGQWFIEGVID